MIRLLRGTVVGRGKDFLTIVLGSAGGAIGFKVFMPEPSLAAAREGESVEIQTYLQVREDALTLFGFATEDELATFELLLSVNGVGPKVALSTLSTLSPDAFRMALANDEPGLIARVPGIGKRTAQKIVLELKDKVNVPADGLVALAAAADADSDVMDALIALGYSVVEAQRALQGLPADAIGTEERLRLALSSFGG